MEITGRMMHYVVVQRGCTMVMTDISIVRSDKGQVLKTSPFKFLYGGQFKTSTKLINPFLYFTSPSTQHHSFFKNHTQWLTALKQLAAQIIKGVFY